MKNFLGTLCIILLCFQADLFGQQLKKGYDFYIGLELGEGNAPGLYAQLFLAMHRDHEYWKIKNSNIKEFGIFMDKPNPRVFEYAALYGRTFKLGRLNNLQLASGIAFAGEIKRGEYIGNDCDGLCLFATSYYQRIVNSTIGLPVELKYNFLVAKIIGIGLSVNADVNSVRTFTSYSVGFSLGKLRD